MGVVLIMSGNLPSLYTLTPDRSVHRKETYERPTRLCTTGLVGVGLVHTFMCEVNTFMCEGTAYFSIYV